MLRVILIISLLLWMAFATAMPAEVNAQGTTQQVVNIPNPLKDIETISQLINAIARFIYMISIPITIIVFLAGAYQFITAAGEPEKLQRARATLLWAAVGFALVLISFSVVTIIKDILGVQ